MIGVLLTIARAVRALAGCVQEQGQEVRPMANGLLMDYSKTHIISEPGRPFSDDCRSLETILKLFLSGSSHLELLRLLLQGEGFDGARKEVHEVSAIASNGICLFVNTLCDLTADPVRAGIIHVALGTIQWNNPGYECITDGLTGTDSRTSYPARSLKIMDDVTSAEIESCHGELDHNTCHRRDYL
jgi:hypothetical protein